MPKRTHSEITTTAAAESPKKRGRPSKKLEPQGSPGETDPWILVNTRNRGGDFWPRSLNQDKRVISLIRKYLANSSAWDKFSSKKGVRARLAGIPYPEERVEMNRFRDIDNDLAWKLEEIGVFESIECRATMLKWKLKRLSKLTAEERENIDSGLMSEEDRAEHQRSQGRVYRGKYSLP